MKSVTDMLRDAGKTKAAESIESKQSERKPPSVFRKPNPVARKIDKGRSSPSDPISKSIEKNKNDKKQEQNNKEVSSPPGVFDKFNPVADKIKTSEPEPGVPFTKFPTYDVTYMNPSEFRQDLYNQEQKYQSQADYYYNKSFSPFNMYFVDGKLVRGNQATAMYRSTGNNLLDEKAKLFSLREQSRDWHSSTKISKSKEDSGYSYSFDFPFSGADIYNSTRENIVNANPLQRFALALTPSNFAGVPATVEYLLGNNEKAYQIEVESVADTHRPFHEFYLASPMGTIGLMAVTYGASAAATPYVGYLSASHPVATAVAGKTISTGFKTAILTYGTYDFAKNVSEGEIGKGFGNAFRLGLNYYGMSKIGEYGMNRINPKTGQTYFAEGAMKGQLNYNARLFDKDAEKVLNLLNKQGGRLYPHQEQQYMTAWKAGSESIRINYEYNILSDAALNKTGIYQPEPSWNTSGIKNISNNRFLQGFRNIWKGNRSSKLIGGMGSNKPLTGDIDIQLTPYGKAQFNSILKNLGYKLDLGQGVDWHYMQPTGSMVTTHGGVSLSPYRYPSGGMGIKWQEQLTRLFHSGWNPAHAGRVKDITEGYRMVQQIYPSGFPKSMGFTMSDYAKVVNFSSQHPNIMNSVASNLYYNPSFSDTFFKDVKSGIYEKTMGWHFKNQSINIKNIIDTDSSGFSFSTNYTPPSISWSPSSILSPMQISAAINPSKNIYPTNFVRMYRNSPRFATTSTSFTFPGFKSSSISRTKSSSVTSGLFSSSTSRSFSSIGSSMSKSLSSIGSNSLSKSISSMGRSFSSSSKSNSSTSSSSSSSSFISSGSSSSSSSSKSSSIIGSGFGLPPGFMSARGTSGYAERLLGTRYRYREFKVPSLKKLFGGMKL